MYWTWIVLFYTINKHTESCDRVDSPRVDYSDSSWVEWGSSKPIGVCEPQSLGLNLVGSSKFICQNGNVLYKVYNNSNTCSEQSMYIKTYSVQAPSFACGANSPCQYAHLKAFIPKNWTNSFTPLNCEHKEDALTNYIVTDVCITDNGNYSKATCQGQSFTMTQYSNQGCTGQILSTTQIINGCNVNQLYWNYEIVCNDGSPSGAATQSPTVYTTAPTNRPTAETLNPTTLAPTDVTSYPTTGQPTERTSSPSDAPSDEPTPTPTDEPTTVQFPSGASYHSITISIVIVGVCIFCVLL